MVWFILNDIKYLNIINGVFISRTNEMIENDLINTFKYLNLSKQDFHEFIKNKKISSWRYRNENIKNLTISEIKLNKSYACCMIKKK